jgi:hypothetical protein
VCGGRGRCSRCSRCSSGDSMKKADTEADAAAHAGLRFARSVSLRLAAAASKREAWCTTTGPPPAHATHAALLPWGETGGRFADLEPLVGSRVGGPDLWESARRSAIDSLSNPSSSQLSWHTVPSSWGTRISSSMSSSHQSARSSTRTMQRQGRDW